MKTIVSFGDLTRQFAVSIRILPVTVAICSGLYIIIVLLAAQIVPYSASGSLIRSENGQVVGSECIAQQFSRPEYFWPRPSAVSWNAAAAGGSNLSPASLVMRQRTEKLLAVYALKKGQRVPADLVTASGSGLDPDISLSAASFQAARVAHARDLALDRVMSLVNTHAAGRRSAVLQDEPLVNVLVLNRELDRLKH
ncbi:MAG: potassium-transporting ATPase subunit C [Chlorobium sp.]|nr:MAG: potassium-transporting ATPase subunit C [Chlorobium sp.]